MMCRRSSRRGCLRSGRGGWWFIRRCQMALFCCGCGAPTTMIGTGGLAWTPLHPESLVAAPCLIDQTLCQPSSSGAPQLAKDVDYAKAILEAWRQDDVDAAWDTEWNSIVYHEEETDPTKNKKMAAPLHGHLVRNQRDNGNGSDNNNAIGILFCHTGAGPHDLFLLWKAAALVHALSASSANIGVVVLIADLLSDESGWAWNDRTRYETARQELLHSSTDPISLSKTTTTRRPVLERRLRAAEQCLRRQVQLQSNNNRDDDVRIAALGWCLGGHAVVELARLKLPTIRAMATFHGVFDHLPPPLLDHDTSSSQSDNTASEILICHGLQDPFVPSQDLEMAL